MITASAIPFTNFALLESLKAGRPGYLHAGVIIFIVLMGQLILVGSALNIFYIPLYAIARWSQVRSVPLGMRTMSAHLKCRCAGSLQ
jgi:hypothetical protein